VTRTFGLMAGRMVTALVSSSKSESSFGVIRRVAVSAQINRNLNEAYPETSVSSLINTEAGTSV